MFERVVVDWIKASDFGFYVAMSRVQNLWIVLIISSEDNRSISSLLFFAYFSSSHRHWAHVDGQSK